MCHLPFASHTSSCRHHGWTCHTVASCCRSAATWVLFPGAALQSPMCRLHSTGLRDLTVVADKARLAQKGLYDVDSLLLTITRALSDSHPPEAQSGAFEASKVYDPCCKRYEQAAHGRGQNVLDMALRLWAVITKC